MTTINKKEDNIDNQMDPEPPLGNTPVGPLPESSPSTSSNENALFMKVKIGKSMYSNFSCCFLLSFVVSLQDICLNIELKKKEKKLIYNL